MSEESRKFIDKIQFEEITIRKAKQDLEEGNAFAHFFNEASEGFFTSILGVKTDEILARAFIEPNNEYSFENVWMLEYKNKVVGMVSGYTLFDKKRFRKNILSEFWDGARLRIMMFSLIGRVLSSFLGPRETDDYYLQAIAVSKLVRGKGIGQKMLKHIEEIAIQKESKTLSLDVSSKNEKAIRSYQKFGMEVHSIWPDFLKMPSVFTRMVKEL